jgi:hypothetical protein
MAAAAADVDLSDLAAAVAGFRQRGGHLQPVMERSPRASSRP